MVVRSGPWLLALPVLTVIGLWLLRAPSPELPPAEEAPSVSDADASIAIWTAEVAGLDGSSLNLRLLPLHGETARAKFDADTLRLRYGLPEGQVWRLDWEPAGGEPLGEWPRVFISDRGGSALVGFSEAVRLAGQPLGKPVNGLPESGVKKPSGPQDPVLALLFGVEQDSEGRVGQWLWGRAPDEGAELVWEAGSPGKNGDRHSSSPLLPGVLPCGELPRYLRQILPEHRDSMSSRKDG